MKKEELIKLARNIVAGYSTQADKAIEIADDAKVKIFNTKTYVESWKPVPNIPEMLQLIWSPVD